MDYASKIYALLNQEDKRHFQEVLQYLDPREEDRVLEIGCSRGFVVKAVQDIVPETYGIDVNEEAIKAGVTRNLSVMSAESLDFDNENFDKIYSFHVIEHLSNIQQALREMERVLRPGGKLLLVYPAEPIRGLFSIPTSVILFKNPFRAKEVHLHKLTPEKLKEFLKETTLEQKHSSFSFFSSPQFFSVFQKEV